MNKFAIRGHCTRGREVIKILEMLGANNSEGYAGSGDWYYCISDNEIIRVYYWNNFTVFTLEEFLEKFPYKVGDKVCFPDDLSTPFTINKMWWDENANELLCSFIEDDIEVPVVGIRTYKEETLEVTEEFYNKHCVNCGSQRCTHNGEWLKECEHYKEETTNKAIFEGNAQSCDIMNNIIKENMKEIKIDIPKGYKFFGIDDDNKIVLTEKQPQYPKTYRECSLINGCEDRIPLKIIEEFIKLINARNAYWKIAGKQLGLDKPWEPDWSTKYENKYVIEVYRNNVRTNSQGYSNTILAFPTPEMRDAFYENFKELIEQCKELL